jgi:hypothetical protein
VGDVVGADVGSWHSAPRNPPKTPITKINAAAAPYRRRMMLFLFGIIC